PGDCRGIELAPQPAAARARFLDSGNDCRAPRGDLRAERAFEVARRRRSLCRRFDHTGGPRPPQGSDFFPFGRENLCEDIRHRQACAAPSFVVSATNAASFFLAAPERMAARARSMPAAIDPAT